MVTMKKPTLPHLNKCTFSPWSPVHLLTDSSFIDFMRCVYHQETYLASASKCLSQFFSISALTELLNTRRLSFPRCRLIKNGSPVSPVSYTRQKQGALGEVINTLHVKKVTQYIDEGATLVIDFCEDLWGPINEVCGDISTVFREKTGATLFFSAGQETGFTSHWDNSDVIVYQLSGKKRWKIYGQTVEMPVDENKEMMLPSAGPPAQDITLEADHMLYIPRGYWHAPEPCGDHSLHVSFAFRRRNGMDYLKWLLPKLCEELIVRMDIDRHADSPDTQVYLDNLKATLCEYINEQTLGAYIENCNCRQLKDEIFTVCALLKNNVSPAPGTD